MNSGREKAKRWMIGRRRGGCRRRSQRTLQVQNWKEVVVQRREKRNDGCDERSNRIEFEIEFH